MTTRRDAIGHIGAMMAGLSLAPRALVLHQQDTPPAIAPGAPESAERRVLIDDLRKRIDGVDQRFEAREHRSDWTMPYRLFTPAGSGPFPLVLYLHGSGGMGTDNQKQMTLGNVFGTRVWAEPEQQKEYPCFVVVPQTDRGWVRYGDPAPGDSVARVVPGLGEGARLALEVVDALRRELPIDSRRLYLTGQSMGGAGAWHLLVQRPGLFAAAAICCGSETLDDVTRATSTPIWNFHGDVDAVVPISVSRDRVSALRKAGGRPIATEYAGVGHNVWDWAYSEPALARWMFSKSLGG